MAQGGNGDGLTGELRIAALTVDHVFVGALGGAAGLHVVLRHGLLGLVAKGFHSPGFRLVAAGAGSGFLPGCDTGGLGDHGPFAPGMSQGFNIRFLHTRPLRTEEWGYYFYTECDGDDTSAEGQKMLADLKAVCETLKFVGRYPSK
jgi:hypothetical protein